MSGCLGILAKFSGVMTIIIIVLVVLSKSLAERDDNRRIQNELNKSYEELNRNTEAERESERFIYNF